MNKTQYFLKKHSSTILTVVGAGGVVATTVLAVKATPKALQLIENAKLEKGGELTRTETVKVAWKPYIPAAITGFSTIACIFGANYLNTKNQASLMSAYALLDNAYKEYRNKVGEVYEDAKVNIEHALVKAKYDSLAVHEGKTLFYDHQGMRFFESTLDEVFQAEKDFMEVFENRGYACLNEYYDMLGIEGTEYGYQLGWFSLENNDPYNCSELEFEYEQTFMENNIECWIIKTNMPPALDYIL